MPDAGSPTPARLHGGDRVAEVLHAQRVPVVFTLADMAKRYAKGELDPKFG